MSSTLSIIPLIASLISGSDYLNHTDFKWQPNNKSQKHFINNYIPNSPINTMREFLGLGEELDLLAPRINDITFLEKSFGKENRTGL